MPEAQSIARRLRCLQAQGLDRLEAQLLLLHVLGLAPNQRGWLLAHDSDALPQTQTERLEALARRRLAGEPLAYLTGCQAFYGLDLHINADVLVPRPDTETLVDWALERLAGEAATVLDLGTGSGAIALALKANHPALKVWASDASVAALKVARNNAQRLQLDVVFHRGAWLSALPVDAPRFDCIVSNPPYIAVDDPHLPSLRFEPAQALGSGSDGLDDLRLITATAPEHLVPGGWLLLEHGYDQAAAVRALLLAAGLEQVQSRRDLAGVERCSGGRRAHLTDPSA